MLTHATTLLSVCVYRFKGIVNDAFNTDLTPIVVHIHKSLPAIINVVHGNTFSIDKFVYQHTVVFTYFSTF